MVRLTVIMVAILGAALSALMLAPAGADASVSAQNAATTIGFAGEVLEPGLEVADVGGLVCGSESGEDDTRACTGKTLVTPLVIALAPAPPVIPSHMTAPAQLITAEVALNPRPPKAA